MTSRQNDTKSYMRRRYYDRHIGLRESNDVIITNDKFCDWINDRDYDGVYAEPMPDDYSFVIEITYDEDVNGIDEARDAAKAIVDGAVKAPGGLRYTFGDSVPNVRYINSDDKGDSSYHYFEISNDALDESYRPSCGSRLFERVMLNENYVEVSKRIIDAISSIIDMYTEKGIEFSDDARKQMEYLVYKVVEGYRKAKIKYDANIDVEDADAEAAFNKVEDTVHNAGYIPADSLNNIHLQGFILYLIKKLKDSDDEQIKYIGNYFEKPDNKTRLQNHLYEILFKNKLFHNWMEVDAGSYKTINLNDPNNKQVKILKHRPSQGTTNPVGTEFYLDKDGRYKPIQNKKASTI